MINIGWQILVICMFLADKPRPLIVYWLTKIACLAKGTLFPLRPAMLKYTTAVPITGFP